MLIFVEWNKPFHMSNWCYNPTYRDNIESVSRRKYTYGCGTSLLRIQSTLCNRYPLSPRYRTGHRMTMFRWEGHMISVCSGSGHNSSVQIIADSVDAIVQTRGCRLQKLPWDREQSKVHLEDMRIGLRDGPCKALAYQDVSGWAHRGLHQWTQEKGALDSIGLARRRPKCHPANLDGPFAAKWQVLSTRLDFNATGHESKRWKKVMKHIGVSSGASVVSLLLHG